MAAIAAMLDPAAHLLHGTLLPATPAEPQSEESRQELLKAAQDKRDRRAEKRRLLAERMAKKETDRAT
jgi:hypothetical protein